MTSEQFAGVVRHVLGAVGAWLVANGVLEEGVVAEASGAVLTLAALVWSLASKRGK